MAYNALFCAVPKMEHFTIGSYGGVHSKNFYHDPIPESRGMDLTRFLSGTCHRGFKSIPFPYTNILKKCTQPYNNISKKYIGHYISYRNPENRHRSLYQIVKIDTVLYTNIWKIDTLPDGTSSCPKCMWCTRPPRAQNVNVASDQCFC